MNSYASATQKVSGHAQKISTIIKFLSTAVFGPNRKTSANLSELKKMYSLQNNSKTSPKLESRLYEQLFKRGHKIFNEYSHPARQLALTNASAVLNKRTLIILLKKDEPQTSDTRIKAHYIKKSEILVDHF